MNQTTSEIAMASTSDPTPSWLELPREITATILQKLGAVEILTTARRVCSAWKTICEEPSMWRCIDMRSNKGIDDVWDVRDHMVTLCLGAVDRSQGQLLDINIEHFGTDDLLLYISRRASQLRRLRLVCCYGITSQGVIEAVKNFPLLEELHLYYTSIGIEAIEAVGQSCAHLKSFKLNNQGYRRPHVVCDLEALAVAKTMPELRHLQLFGNKLTDEGLQAILDGCPHLESLDLRQCFNVHLGGDLGKQCAEQIKDLKRPLDSTDDYGFDVQLHDYESSEDDYITGFSDIDMVSDLEDYMEFSGGSVSSYDYEDDVIFD